jgi:hypothetical protein
MDERRGKKGKEGERRGKKGKEGERREKIPHSRDHIRKLNFRNNKHDILIL